MVVQVVCFRPPKVNGKTQFPHVPVPDPGAAVVELTFADSHGTAAASSLTEGGLQVLILVSWESSQSLK
jgi:hypothetical protein